MPRETVHDEAGLYDIQVGWQLGQDVQIGVETVDHRSIVDTLAGDRVSDPKVRAALDQLMGGGELASFTGLWSTLDRAGCNRLIELIRRARDSAYGKDQ